MPILLRINHQKQDVIFQVLTEKPSLQPQLEVFLGGKTYLFEKQSNYWTLSKSQDIEIDDPTLFEAIAKALALRFRISTSVNV